MVVPEDREGRDGDNSVLARGSEKPSDVMMAQSVLARQRQGRHGGAEVRSLPSCLQLQSMI